MMWATLDSCVAHDDGQAGGNRRCAASHLEHLRSRVYQQPHHQHERASLAIASRTHSFLHFTAVLNAQIHRVRKAAAYKCAEAGEKRKRRAWRRSFASRASAE